MHTLYKKGDCTDPLNSRGIALFNTITKIFTTLYAKRLGKWAETCYIIPVEQAGFWSKQGCIDQLFILPAIINVNFQTKRLHVGVFVDFKKAFVSVRHEKLRHKLFELRVSGKILKIKKVFMTIRT